MTDKDIPFNLDAALRGEPFRLRDPSLGEVRGPITVSPDGKWVSAWWLSKTNGWMTTMFRSDGTWYDESENGYAIVMSPSQSARGDIV